MTCWTAAPPAPSGVPDVGFRCPSAQQRCFCQGDWHDIAQPSYQQANCPCQAWGQPASYADLNCPCGGDFVQEYPVPSFNNGYYPSQGDFSPLYQQTQCMCQEYQPCTCQQQWGDGTNQFYPGPLETEYQTQYCSGDSAGLEQNQICPCCGKRTLNPNPPIPVCRCPEQSTIQPGTGGLYSSGANTSPGNFAGGDQTAPIVVQCYPVYPGGCPLPCNQGNSTFSLATSPMSQVTVYSASYKPVTPVGCRAHAARPRDNLHTAAALPMPCGCAPVFCPSPPPQPPCIPRDNCGVVTGTAGSCPMASLTINRASYQPVPVIPRTPCPWVPVQGYQYPWPPLQATTVYDASYMPPGCVTPVGFVPSRPTTGAVPAGFAST